MRSLRWGPRRARCVPWARARRARPRAHARGLGRHRSRSTSTSVFELCRLAGALMVPRGAGKIITMASMLSFQGGFGAAAYAASKGGVAQLTKALANEWAGSGVNVNAIAPGYVKTPLNRHIWRDDPARSDASPRAPAGGTLGRAGRPRRRGRVPRIPRRRLRARHRAAGGWRLAWARYRGERWLSGLRVLVTGAAGGLGRALVVEADLRGARVVATGRRPTIDDGGASRRGDQGGGRPARSRRMP